MSIQLRTLLEIIKSDDQPHDYIHDHPESERNLTPNYYYRGTFTGTNQKEYHVDIIEKEFDFIIIVNDSCIGRLDKLNYNPQSAIHFLDYLTKYIENEKKKHEIL